MMEGPHMYLKHLHLLVALFVFTSLASAKLPNRVRSDVTQQLIPAYFRGDTTDSLKLLSALVAKLDQEELAEVDALLEKGGVPAVGSLLLSVRFKAMLEGDHDMPKPHVREASLALPVLRDRIEGVLSDVEQLPVLEDQIPEYESLDDYEQAFWEIHVAANRLRNAARMAQYGADSVNAALTLNLKSVSDEQLTAMDIDFETLGDETSQLAKDLQEAKVELRIRAVAKAADVIQNSSDFRQRLRAAYVIDFDGRRLIEVLRAENRPDFSRPELDQKNLLASIETYVRLARESAGDLITKSRLLYHGMHWWMRGRYGLGPDGFGLLKSVSSLKSPLAQFPLYMPTTKPVPTAPPRGSYSVPRFDRRHHYIWMYEYRVLRQQRTDTVLRDQQRTETHTKLSEFY